MKGVVFNLLEAFVVERFGEEKYEEILALCPLETKEPFVGPGTYPDHDLVQLAERTASTLGLELPVALRAFGRYCFPRLARYLPNGGPDEPDAKAFLMRLEPVIHVEVRKLMKGALTPRFTNVDTGPDSLLLRYDSGRRLCAFAEGLLDGLGDHYGTRLDFTHSKCLHRGDAMCEFAITFSKQERSAA